MADSTQKKAAAAVIVALGGGAALMLGIYFSAGATGPGTYQTPAANLEVIAEAGVADETPPMTSGGQTGAQGTTGVPRPLPSDSAAPLQGSSTMPEPAKAQGSPGSQGESSKPEADARGPAGWPSAVPFPERSQIIEEDRNGHARFVLLSTSGIATTGGTIVAALQDSGWKVQVVGTVRSATITARRGSESLGVALRDQSSPEGPLTHWDLVYQQEPPPIPDPEPTPSNSLQERA